tara:strand:- start:36 stop:227 length:192 start_codon:yes stop_codon:yes gene_type:complete
MPPVITNSNVTTNVITRLDAMSIDTCRRSRSGIVQNTTTTSACSSTRHQNQAELTPKREVNAG